MEESPTKRKLSADEVSRFARLSFGPDTQVTDCGELSGGGFAAIVEDVLADAATWGVDLPVDAQVIRQCSPAPGLDGAMWLSGLVDGEWFLFGDPLIDFVSPAISQRMEDFPEHPFLRGYAQTLGRPITFNAGAKRRLALYRMHLYLLMTVELPSRAMNPGNHTYRGKALAAEVEALKANT